MDQAKYYIYHTKYTIEFLDTLRFEISIAPYNKNKCSVAVACTSALNASNVNYAILVHKFPFVVFVCSNALTIRSWPNYLKCCSRCYLKR